VNMASCRGGCTLDPTYEAGEGALARSHSNVAVMRRRLTRFESEQSSDIKDCLRKVS
jgi:hypothetical protein